MANHNLKIFKISGMDCPSCAMLIESELEDVGIKAKVSYAKETIEVHEINKELFHKISRVVSNLGYKIEI